MEWQPGLTLDDVEKRAIQKAFSFFHKNKTQTANALGIAVRTLDSKIEKYDIEPKKTLEQKPKVKEPKKTLAPKVKEPKSEMFNKLMAKA